MLLRNFRDNVTGLGAEGFLESYSFEPYPGLKTPLVTQGSIGIESKSKPLDAIIGFSVKKIISQIYLSYGSDSTGNQMVTPRNLDDRFMEIFALSKLTIGPLTSEISGSYRQWQKRFFPDGLEKGPAALGFARLSYLKEVFVPRLFLGGSIEARISSRRDYRSIQPGFTSAYTVLFGRLEFRYKDFIFTLDEDNIANSNYISSWPYYAAPRTVWWNLRWTFFD